MPRLNSKGSAQIIIFLILFVGLIAVLSQIVKTQILKPKAASNTPNVAKNILLSQAQTPVDEQGDRIVFQSEKLGVSNPSYSIEYQPQFDLFMLVIDDTPPEQVRETAEKDLLLKAGNDLESLCGLNFTVIAQKEVTDDGYVAYDNRLAICKKLQEQLGNPPTENFTPSLGDTIQSIGSDITQGGGRAFLSNKPIVTSENLPSSVYITLCRNNGTNAAGVWQITDNPQAAYNPLGADGNTYANQEDGRCNYPVPNYLVFTQDVPKGAYLSLCETEDGSQTPREAFWQVDNSGRVADFRGVREGCSQAPALPQPTPKQSTVYNRLLSSQTVDNVRNSVNQENLCTAEKLTPYFSSNAQKASLICFRESGGQPLALNTGCLSGKSLDYSVGLFQINLLAQCQGAFTYNARPISCSIIDENKKNGCLKQYQNVETNIQKAVEMSGNGTNWQPWGQ